MEKIWLQQYEPGVPESIPPHQGLSLPQIFETSFSKFKDRPAFHNMGTTLTFGEMDILSRRFGAFCQRELNLQKGDRIGLMMPNVLQYPVALFGALRAGLIVVNINPLYTTRELEHQLCDAGVETLVIFANSAHLMEKLRDQTPVKNIVVTQVGDLLSFPKNILVNTVLKYLKKMVPPYRLPGSYSFNQAMILGDEEQFTPIECLSQDTAFLQYTGGTTGVAKGAELTHGNIIANMMQAKAWIASKIQEGDEIIITPLPLYHIFSLTVNCFIFTYMGGLNVLITNPRDMKGFIKELRQWRFTCFTGVNTLYNGLLNQPDFANLDFSHLKLCIGGGMAVQRPVAEKWQKVTGLPLIEGYGLTETSPIACINPVNNREYSGAIGLPVSSTEVDIRDEDGKSLPLGEVGEICIRGPQVMKGYWQRPEETAQVMTEDGYFRSGDMGIMNPQGLIKIVDRKKDMILVSGFNVYPNEIEEVLSGHPKVLECAAVGMADAKSGEVVKIFVVKKDDSLTEEEVLDFARENLTNYKRPRYVEFRTELPKSNVGKILRKELRGV